MPLEKPWSQPGVNCWSLAVSPSEANSAARSQASFTAALVL